VDQEHIDARKISVIYNGVDLQPLASAGGINPFANADWAGASHIVTCIANMRRIKGIDVLVRCAHKVCREFPQAIFLIAGTLYEPRAYTEEIQRMVRDLGLENNVKLLGFVENPAALLKMSDAFCLLSRSEGFSNALLEAMACGVPSVVTRVGGNPEAIVDGENGFLVSPEDDEVAAQRLLSILKDPAMASKVGHAGRVTIEKRFSAEIMIQRLVQVYEELMVRRAAKKD
jgi:glycosyltransferase involved in cell wall biosynthesis